jgi:hypothetical protein
MKSVFILALLSALIVCGCKKKDAGNAQEPATPPSVKANAENGIHENVVGDVDPALTAQLRAYIQKKGRMPASFTEFHREALDSLPQPPAGKKWVIDSTSQSVKSIPAQ